MNFSIPYWTKSCQLRKIKVNMALIERFPSITQQQINKTLLRCQANASVYVKENSTGKGPLSPDFEEMLDNMAKLNDMVQGGQFVRKLNDTVLVDNSWQKAL